MGWIAWSVWQSESALRNWPKTHGVLENIEIIQEFSKTSSRSATSTLQSNWAISVRYRYTVGAHNFTGTRLSNAGWVRPVNSDGAPEDLVKKFEKYRTLRTIEVFYSRENPSKSYLEIETANWRYYAFAAASLMALAIVFLLAKWAR